MGDLSIMKSFQSDATAEAAVRLLIPIDASETSRRGLLYAAGLATKGTPVEACLLYIAEPMRSWEVLSFYTVDEVRQHFLDRSELILGMAANSLTERGIPCRTYFREADAVRGVIDMAEELACSEIVLPRTHLLGVFPTGLGPKLRNLHCSIPVTLINAEGSIAA